MYSIFDNNIVIIGYKIFLLLLYVSGIVADNCKILNIKYIFK